jgi:hypothetical protein
MLRSTGKVLAVATALALPLAACGDGAGPRESGRVSILLTDAPGDIQTAVVKISHIYLQPGDEESAARVDLMTTPQTVSLLDLMNDVVALVEDATVPGGTYNQLRFVIDGGYIEVENAQGGTSVYATPGFDLPAGVTADGTLICPSCAQTGIKVTFPGGISVAGDQKVVLVDFDVAQSFGHQAGGSGNWVMHPVIRGVEMQFSGSATVTLELADGLELPELEGEAVTLGDFQARLEDSEGHDQGSVAFTEVGGEWVAQFLYLLPASYVVTIEGPEGLAFTVDPESAPIVIGSSGSATAAFTLTEASVE